MLNWLKKGSRNDEAQGKNLKPAGLQTMRSDLQKKFSKGVQYNLKIIIRGDRSSGKTCLWHRLQGNKFIEEYVPTPEIQATSIHWNYKATDDIVKVDVWDVVDKGKPKRQNDSLVLSHKEQEDDDDDSHKLDASFLDVYKGAHAVIMVFDITKKWTFKYIEQELPKIPVHIPTLILANHRDMGDHRVISFDELQYLVEAVDRPPGSAGVLFLESSMKTGFGLKFIHKFFNLPFLLLQRESLLKQLETNHLDVESCLEELQYEPGSEEQNYDYSAKLLKEKQNQPKSSPPDDAPPKSNGHPKASVSPEHPNATHVKEENAKRLTSPPSSLPVAPPSVQETSKSNNGGLFSPSMMTAEASSPKEPKKRGFLSIFSKSSSKPDPAVKVEVATPAIVTPTEPSSISQPPQSIDEFVPDEDDADNFFREAPTASTSQRYVNAVEESSDEDDDGNPMVAGFQEELDSDDEIDAGGGSSSHKVYSYSDSDEDYATSSKSQKHHSFEPISSRSTPKSRVSPKPRKEDAKLQHFVIESDDEDTAEEKPSVMQDKESLSGDDSYEVPISIDASFPIEETCSHEDAQEIPKPVFESDEKTDDYNDLNDKKTHQSGERNNFAPPSDRQKRSSLTNDVSSDDDEVTNQMVSTIVEDFSSDEETSSKPAGGTKGSVEEEDPGDDSESHRMSLQLQSSDLDFLEQITNSSSVKQHSPDGDKKDSKSSSHKSKSRHHKARKHDEGSEESVHKKHKHKKKKKSKSKDVDTSNADSKNSKKKSNHGVKISEEDKNLEAFLGGGEGYEGL